MTNPTELREAKSRLLGWIEAYYASDVEDEFAKDLRLVIASARDHSPPAGSALEALEDVRAALKRAQEVLRLVAADRRKIGPIAAHAQQADWQVTRAIDLLSQPPQEDESPMWRDGKCYECGVALVGPYCPACNPQQDDATGGGAATVGYAYGVEGEDWVALVVDGQEVARADAQSAKGVQLIAAGRFLEDIAYRSMDVQPGVPAGWRLVPEEPTEAMVHAGLEPAMYTTGVMLAEAYRAMLAAAPKGVGQ